MTKQYPVLTYGTLRPGCHNYVLLDGYTIFEQTVKVNGFDMYGGQGYPYIVDGAGTIEATLTYIAPEVYDEVLADLDHLEGFHRTDSAMNHYDRAIVTVDVNGTQVEAYIYVARNPRVIARATLLPLVEDGNWLTFQYRRFYETV